jgi:hypothetical protein
MPNAEFRKPYTLYHKPCTFLLPNAVSRAPKAEYQLLHLVPRNPKSLILIHQSTIRNPKSAIDDPVPRNSHPAIRNQVCRNPYTLHLMPMFLPLRPLRYAPCALPYSLCPMPHALSLYPTSTIYTSDTFVRVGPVMIRSSRG